MEIRTIKRRLADGLAGWLTFEFSCFRGYLFSEKYLAMPVGQLLLANTRGVVHAEQNHPILATPGRRGRPPQLDFVVLEGERPTLAVETKWVGNSTVRPVDLLWDCVRLHLAGQHYGCEAILVLGGLNKRIKDLFKLRDFHTPNRKGVDQPILPIDPGKRGGVRVEIFNGRLRPALNEQFVKYPKVDFPRALIASHPIIRPHSTHNLSFSIWIWHIGPDATGKTFRM